MSTHFDVLGRFRLRSGTHKNIKLDSFDDRLYVLGVGLKCADIGHAAKEFELHKTWSDMIMEEYFIQGDLEREKG
jgi:3',5'-cyclic-nucleotide phosphodiesterase/cAMP-specific phosphodiesterase 4